MNKEEERAAAIDIASDIAGELAPLIDSYLMHQSDIQSGFRGKDLRDFLWDNKIGILRVCEQLGKGKQMEESLPFAEALADLINEYLSAGTDDDEIISELELQLMALKEKE